MELEYCDKCIEGNCPYHKWFTDANPKIEKDVLITCLRHTCEDLPNVFEKVYLAESVIHGCHEQITVGGKLKFDFDDIPVVHKKDERYIPLSCYSFSEEVVEYDIAIEVTLMRHHPTELIIKKGMLFEKEMYRIDLINFDDNLHCESISDYPEILNLATKRLNEFINKVETENNS